MRLAELNPRWIEFEGRRIGVAFDCPCCVGAPIHPGPGGQIPAKWRGGPLAILFANPIEGGPPHPVDSRSRYELGLDTWLRYHHFGGEHWQRTGDTFETLTLSPSINCDGWKHWHGHVSNGAITP